MTITQEDNLIIQSYMTVSFLLELKKLDFLNSDYYKKAKFQDEYVKAKLPEIKIDNQGSMLMVLYAMLVIPSELIKVGFSDEFNNVNKVIHTIRNKTRTYSNYEYDSVNINYIKHIRNSVAHAKVKFVPNVEVIFSDNRYNYDTKKKESCKITIPLSEFGIFMTALQKLFFQYVKTASQNSSN